MTRGFVYCAYGERFIDEAVGSIRMLRKHNPGANVCLLTDQEGRDYYHRHYDIGPESADVVNCIPINRELYCSFKTSLETFSPYEKTVALETDIHVASDIRNLFDLLDTFDFAAAPDNTPYPSSGAINGLKGGYAALGMYNSGVLVFRKSPAVRQLFENWKREFSGLENDEKALIRALVQTEIRFISLPWEYNLRLTNKCVSFNGHVKIVHGRVRHPEKFIKMINADANSFDSGSRVWVPTLQCVVSAQTFYYYGRLLKLLNLDKAQWGGRSRIPQTSVLGNLVGTIRSIWR